MQTPVHNVAHQLVKREEAHAHKQRTRRLMPASCGSIVGTLLDSLFINKGPGIGCEYPDSGESGQD